MTRRPHHAVAACLALAACARPAPAPPAPALPLEGRWVLTGEVVTIASLAGELRVEPGTGPDVVVEARAHGPAAGLLRAELRRRAGGDALRVRLAGQRLVYPALATRGDSIAVRPAGDAYEPAGGFLDRLAGGLLGRREPIRIVRRGAGPRAAGDLTVRLPPGRRVRLLAAAGTIVIAGTSGEIDAGSLFAPVHADDVAGVLRVRAHQAPVLVRGGRAELAVRTRAGGVDLEDVRGPAVVVRTSAGSIRAAGVEAPLLDLHTQAGALTVERARARRIRLDTGAGSIAGGDILADTLTAETGAGRIVLEGAGAPAIALDTGKGDVRLLLTGDVGRLDIDAGGAVTVEAPRTLDAVLRIEAGKGDIVLAIPTDTTRAAAGLYEGRAGAGRGRVRIDAARGVAVTNDAGPRRRDW